MVLVVGVPGAPSVKACARHFGVRGCLRVRIGDGYLAASGGGLFESFLRTSLWDGETFYNPENGIERFGSGRLGGSGFGGGGGKS